MKAVSENFKAKAENPFGARYNTKIVVDGNALTDSIEDFKYSSMCNPDGEFSFGNTCAASVTFSITQPSVNLSGKEIEVYQGLDVDGELEEILLGKFAVLKLTEDKGKCSYECYDRMVNRMEMPYFSDLTDMVTDVQILNEICEQVGITLANADALVAHELVSTPVGYTRREVIGYMAQLQGRNALINADGNLELIWYTDTDFVVDDEKIYLDGTDSINDETDYTLEYLKCSVTGSDSSETLELTSGGGNIGINFENPFMTQEILDEVFSRIGGFSFRPVEVEFLGDFRLETGDIVTVTTNGVSYVVPIMQLEHSSDGGVITVIQSVAESDEENQIDTKGPVTKQMERYYAELVLLNEALVNKLSADEADIRYLKADEVDVLTAQVEDAIIENLDADYAKVKDLQVTNARVSELETNALTADSAEIKDLEAGVADINELMFGAAGGQSIQTEFSNAVVAQIGNAQIKSAMIENVSASQITAGEINTNNVCVKSEDGRLILSDETLQISDESRVRVQIGKDAEGDYSISIWDEEGNLMFSQGGITDKAIKNAIIRDDMISEGADISAGKLDIDSLFTVINEDGSHTLKSSKIYLNKEEQTLDIAFSNMTTNVGDLQTTQSSQGSQISNIQNQISSKIWQNDITTAVSGIEIGGRNLLVNSKDERSHLYSVSGGPLYYFYEAPEAGEQYVLSFDAKTSNGTDAFYVSIANSNSTVVRLLNATDIGVTTEYKRFTVLINSWPSATNDNIAFFHYTGYGKPINTNNTGTLYIKNVKLEKGNKATDWTPAPEDAEGEIKALSTKYTDISQSLDNITATVASHTTEIENKADGSTVTNLQSQMTTLEASLSGFQSAVSSTYATKTDLNAIEVGGRNLLLKSDVLKNNTSYGIAYYYFGDEAPVEGETYTVTIKGALGSDRTHFRAYNSGGAIQFGKLEDKGNGLFSYTGQWKVSNSSATASNKYLQIYQFTSSGTTASTIEWIKLEKGNKATDWTPAPEDIENEITTINTNYSTLTQTVNGISSTVASHTTELGSLDDKVDDIESTIYKSINEQNTAITQNCESIILEALKSYTETGDFDGFKETTEAQLQLLSDQMTLKFTETSQHIVDVNGELQEQLNTITKYFTFEAEGMTIGQNNSPFKVVIDNDRYSMLVNGVEVLWLDPDGASNIPELKVTKMLNCCGYITEADSNGNVNTRYGGE